MAAWLLVLSSAASAQVPAVLPRLSTFEEEEILRLDAERISDRQVKEVLSKAPAPRVLSFKGTLLADMESFGTFLVQMGYPEERVRNPRDGRYTYDVTWRGCRCEECAELVGSLAWYYEREGMVPMLIGHSGGGVAVSRVLYGLADGDKGSAEEAYVTHERIPIWNPVTRTAESRYTVRDPLTGAQHLLSDLRVPYAATIATGKRLRLALFFPGCARDVDRLSSIPDSVEEFVDFRIDGDLFTAGSDPYRLSTLASRPTVVRNSPLPSSVGHIRAFEMGGLANDSGARAWINTYRPDRARESVPTEFPNIVQAADIWYSIKKHWCLEAQRLIRAGRAGAHDPTGYTLERR